MAPDLLGKLAEHGILGLVLVLFIVMYFRKEKENREQVKELNDRLVKQAEQHKTELNAIAERLITRSETWMMKYHELSTQQTEAINAITDKIIVKGSEKVVVRGK
jgi:hypothetical protein